MRQRERINTDAHKRGQHYPIRLLLLYCMALQSRHVYSCEIKFKKRIKLRNDVKMMNSFQLVLNLSCRDCEALVLDSLGPGSDLGKKKSAKVNEMSLKIVNTARKGLVLYAFLTKSYILQVSFIISYRRKKPFNLRRE